MSIHSRRTLAGSLAVACAMGAALLIALPALAQSVLYDGTMRVIVRTGQVPNLPSGDIPTYGGALNVTPADGISVFPGDANWSTTQMVTNPPTFAGVLQQTTFLNVSNTQTGTAKPGNGPGPYNFTYTGQPGVNPTFGVPSRFGAASAAGGPGDFGGTFPFLFNFTAALVFDGGGGGNPNLACPNTVMGAHGAAGTMDFLNMCIGLTTGPLPAMTLPSVMVPHNVTIMFFDVTTGPVFAAAPAPFFTTTLTAVGSDVRNAAGTSGMIQLVAPFLFNVQDGGPASGQTNQAAAITEWTLTLMPEPGMLLALCSGVAGLVGLRFAERRRHRG